jgi:hypothetical protein
MTSVKLSDVEPDMDRYAKKIAIGFAEWMMSHTYNSPQPGFYSLLPKKFESVSCAYPISELYKNYLQTLQPIPNE